MHTHTQKHDEPIMIYNTKAVFLESDGIREKLFHPDTNAVLCRTENGTPFFLYIQSLNSKVGGGK